MNMNVLPSEIASVVGVIDPDANAAGTYLTAWVSMEDWECLLAIVMAGDLGSSAMLDAKLRQAKDSSGTSAKDITGKAITQLTEAGTDSNKQALINVRREELDIANAFTHVALSMTVATATSDSGGLLLGFFPRYGVANDSDATTVDEVIS